MMCYEEVGGLAAEEEAWEKRRTDKVSDYGGEDEVLGRGTMAATLQMRRMWRRKE